MDNKVLLSVGVFAGVLVAVGVWLLSASGPSPVPGAAPDPAVAGAAPPTARTIDGRDALLNRKVSKRPNTALIMEKTSNPAAQARLDQGAAIAPARDPGPAVYQLDKESIAAAMDERTEDLIACYETALFHTPDLEGRMALTLQLTPQPDLGYAAVDSIETDSQLEAPVFEGCIATVFEELHFDVAEATTLTWPVVFAPEGDAEPAPGAEPEGG